MELPQPHLPLDPHLAPDHRFDFGELEVQAVAHRRLRRGTPRARHDQAASCCSAPLSWEATDQGSNSLSALTGCSAMRSSTKRRYASGLSPLSLAVSSSV